MVTYSVREIYNIDKESDEEESDLGYSHSKGNVGSRRSNSKPLSKPGPQANPNQNVYTPRRDPYVVVRNGEPIIYYNGGRMISRHSTSPKVRSGRTRR